uniref:Uncharacterized protein LOC105060466 n=1 Tax=Elaeis guineensis var. tenera TaxID=51953 RepID=A0A6J0PAM7_ELAGV|nr:uncharacterized protein LOC105060466 [Elaeis guineensis]
MAIMRLKKGMKVEVSSKREVTLGSWRRAEIISGNGHTYQVKYESYQPDMAAATERVPRKFIRPLPPSVVYLSNWAPGNIVEAFDNHSWKLARVSSVAYGDYYFVGIIGSSKQIRAHKSELRVQHFWEDNHWVTTQKDSGTFKDGKVIRCNHHREHPGLNRGLRNRHNICLPPAELCMHASMNHREFGSADLREGNDAHSISSSVDSCSPRSNVEDLFTVSWFRQKIISGNKLMEEVSQ